MSDSSVNRGAGTLLKTVLLAFNKNNINWCYLNGYEHYPETITSDVDILIRTSDLSKTKKTLATLSNIKLIQCFDYDVSSSTYILLRQLDDGRCSSLMLDVSWMLVSSGVSITDSESCINSSNNINDFMVVPPVDVEFVYYLVKRIMKSNLLNDEVIGPSQALKLATLYSKEKNAINFLLEDVFPERYIGLIRQAVQDNDWSGINDQKHDIRRALAFKSFQKRPIKYFFYLALNSKRWINRCLRPAGVVVAFLGMDGAGKSTIIRELEERFPGIFKGQVRFHLRPSCRRSNLNIAPVTNPHAQQPRSRFSSFLKIGYWWVLYFVGYWLKVYPNKVRGRLILFDRYYQDILIDPIRYRYGGSHHLANMVSEWIPKPDIFVVLDSKPEVLRERKPEVPIDMMIKLRCRYQKFSEGRINCSLIDVNKPVLTNVTVVEKIIFEYLILRTQKRSN